MRSGFSKIPSMAENEGLPRSSSSRMRSKSLGAGGLYTVLGVDKTATEREIKKAYRKLALTLHPDKNTSPNADAEFQAIQYAHEVLTDPQKRNIYDRFGDTGLKNFEQMSGSMPPGFLQMGVGIALCLFMVASIPALLFVIFVGMKLDGSAMTWPWVFFPLFFIDAFMGCIVCCIVTAGPPPPEMEDAPEAKMPGKAEKAGTLITFVLFMTTQILLIVKLEGAAFSGLFVLLPIVLREVFAFVFSVIQLGDDLKENSEMPSEEQLGRGQLIFTTLRSHFGWMLFLIFVGLKIDGTVDWSWAVVFLPLYGLWALWWVVDLALSKFADWQERLMQLIFIDTFFYSFMALTVVWLDTASITAIHVLVPVFVFYGLIFCFMCVLCIMMPSFEQEAGGEGTTEEGEHATEEEQAKREEETKTDDDAAGDHTNHEDKKEEAAAKPAEVAVSIADDIDDDGGAADDLD